MISASMLTRAIDPKSANAGLSSAGDLWTTRSGRPCSARQARAARHRSRSDFTVAQARSAARNHQDSHETTILPTETRGRCGTEDNGLNAFTEAASKRLAHRLRQLAVERLAPGPYDQSALLPVTKRSAGARPSGRPHRAIPQRPVGVGGGEHRRGWCRARSAAVQRVSPRWRFTFSGTSLCDLYPPQDLALSGQEILHAPKVRELRTCQRCIRRRGLTRVEHRCRSQPRG